MKVLSNPAKHPEISASAGRLGGTNGKGKSGRGWRIIAMPPHGPRVVSKMRPHRHAPI
jgi:hypothetical protein